MWSSSRNMTEQEGVYRPGPSKSEAHRVLCCLCTDHHWLLSHLGCSDCVCWAQQLLWCSNAVTREWSAGSWLGAYRGRSGFDKAVQTGSVRQSNRADLNNLYSTTVWVSYTVELKRKKAQLVLMSVKPYFIPRNYKRNLFQKLKVFPLRSGARPGWPPPPPCAAQHWGPSHSSRARQREKMHPEWKRRSETLTLAMTC